MRARASHESSCQDLSAANSTMEQLMKDLKTKRCDLEIAVADAATLQATISELKVVEKIALPGKRFDLEGEIGHRLRLCFTF